MKLSRRIVALLVLTVMLISGLVYAASPIEILINGRRPEPTIQAYVVDGEVFVSLEAIAELLGAEVKWSPDKSSVAISTETVSSTSNTQSEAPAEVPKTITVYITKTGSKYHRAGCRHLSKSMISISLDNAKSRGFSPCSVCKPYY